MLNQNVSRAGKNAAETVVRRYRAGWTNLLLAAALTAVNIVLYCLNSDTYFLFSLAFPYYMFDLGGAAEIVPPLIALGLFVFLGLMARKKTGYMIAALVAFVADTLFLLGYSLLLCAIPELGLSPAAFLMDYLGHIWVLVYLIISVCYIGRYKKLMAETADSDAGAAYEFSAAQAAAWVNDAVEPDADAAPEQNADSGDPQ